MTHEHFQSQICRLVETFGKQAYANERVQLIWRACKEHTNDWFTKTVDDLIGCHRQPPLVPDFLNAVGIERERLWKEEKRENENSAKDFWGASVLTDDDRGMFLDAIRRRCRNEIPDTAWTAIVDMMKGACG